MTTNLLLDPQIVAATVTVVLTAIAAVCGYFLREWLTRSKPFVSVIRLEGSSRRGAARVDVPDKAVKASAKSHLLEELAEKSRLNEVFDVLIAAKDIDSRAQEVIDLMEAFCKAVDRKDTSAAQTLLEELMLDEDVDEWLCTLVGERFLPVPASDQSLPVLVECGEERNARGGSFAVGFPGNTLRFGSGLNSFTLHKTSVKAFIELVARLEYEKLGAVFASTARELSRELSIARELIPPLQAIVDKHSQWSSRLYVANLGGSPFLIQTDAELEIRDKSGAKFTEPCFLILLKQDAGKDMRRIRASSPLVCAAQQDTTFDYVTTNTQSDMPAGETVRSMFKSGTAECRITFNIERPGHFTVAKISSQWVKFADTRPSSA